MVGVCEYQQRGGGGGFDAGIYDVCFGAGDACYFSEGFKKVDVVGMWMWRVRGCGWLGYVASIQQ